MEEIPVDPSGLTHLKIQESKHKLFFVKLTPVSTLRPRWYLINFYLDITLVLYPTTPPNRTHYCVFLTKHSDNIHNSYKFSQWWTEWNEYSRCK